MHSHTQILFKRKSDEMIRTTTYPFQNEWTQFLVICSEKNTSASEELRKFIKNFNETHRRTIKKVLETV
jgi:hypothetical protein